MSSNTIRTVIQSDHNNTIHNGVPGISECELCGESLKPDATNIVTHEINGADIVEEVPQYCPECEYVTTNAILYVLGDRYILYATAVDGQECDGPHTHESCDKIAEFQYIDIIDPIQRGCCQRHMKVDQVGRKACQLTGVETYTGDDIQVHFDDTDDDTDTDTDNDTNEDRSDT